ncbi:putative signal transducing protein [Prosthecobacter fusiformis]|uniref:Putative signal transducing protein n=1 Tax=Prosthecobacter fusiformis TaxID=48464 RepID=A0A4R7SRK3_9BACT|nr:DUF2007 domain-containing protein [Prosthecobacter fusiformis]TDU81751.1 putative signal transducing protein [Prosthecobacter fusiformis]
MKPVFVDPDLTRVSFARNLLEAEGISCFIQNENTRTLGPSVAGFSYTQLLDPSLCILDDSQESAAVEIIRTHFQNVTAEGPEWLCKSCNESNPAAFDLCWSCGAEHLP